MIQSENGIGNGVERRTIEELWRELKNEKCWWWIKTKDVSYYQRLTVFTVFMVWVELGSCLRARVYACVDACAFTCLFDRRKKVRYKVNWIKRSDLSYKSIVIGVLIYQLSWSAISQNKSGLVSYNTRQVALFNVRAPPCLCDISEMDYKIYCHTATITCIMCCDGSISLWHFSCCWSHKTLVQCWEYSLGIQAFWMSIRNVCKDTQKPSQFACQPCRAFHFTFRLKYFMRAFSEEYGRRNFNESAFYVIVAIRFVVQWNCAQFVQVCPPSSPSSQTKEVVER